MSAQLSVARVATVATAALVVLAVALVPVVTAMMTVGPAVLAALVLQAAPVATEVPVQAARRWVRSNVVQARSPSKVALVRPSALPAGVLVEPRVATMELAA